MALPPAQPAYILRGHGSQIHATAFIRSNTRLLTGDADGWIVIWSLATKRPVAVWKAHEGSILGINAWGSEKLITHGKDNRLVVWKLSEEDESSMSVVLPVDTPPEPRKQPWLLHILHVNTMNFCSFAQAEVPSTEHELLIAVPNTLSSETVDIFQLPTCQRVHNVPNPNSFKGGMIMALSILHHDQTADLTVIAGYESGHTIVFQHSSGTWQALYRTQAHSQPVLSLDVDPSKEFYLTSSADAIVAKHPIPTSAEIVIKSSDDEPLKIFKTGHAGQQSLKIRNDGKIAATAGWDSRVRVYGTKNMKELAVLKWHKEGCYAVAFANVLENSSEEEKSGGELVKRTTTLTVKGERLLKAKTAHWIAVGSKDGKVSLWDIY
ncbi:WD domain-containing protein [Mollisia scopiformis]|uniref:ASTRA-associated protein 1 n=1 Tax=Mollisia scopiformis TaxID=149040 RepID=A0A194X8Z9_MOLSC|nr:WD domain-containing protein [Mollisia scopiformis]KUJ16262.1 WD domain-containing protein [Mollisia scopiformis]